MAQHETQAERQPVKRHYDPPKIISQQVFETTALACGKLPSQGGPCTANKKTS